MMINHLRLIISGTRVCFLLQQETDQPGSVPSKASEEQEEFDCQATARRRGSANQLWL